MGKSDHRKKMTRKLPDEMTDSTSNSNNTQHNPTSEDASDCDEPNTPVIKNVRPQQSPPRFVLDPLSSDDSDSEIDEPVSTSTYHQVQDNMGSSFSWGVRK